MDFSAEIHDFDDLGDSNFESISRLPDSPSCNGNDPEDDTHQENDPGKDKHPGNKKSRKKLQQKQVVYVPIVGDPNKQKGETPHTDQWNWRKYGQKPIKGSPYPRGYYRCSSSKGCSARKQVERSRKDPSKLVITYTSEHNHPILTNKNTKGSNNAVKNNVLPNASNNLKSNINNDADSPQEISTNANVIDANNGASNDTDRYNYFSSIINGSSPRVTTNHNNYHDLEEIEDNQLVGVTSSFVQVEELLDTVQWEHDVKDKYVPNGRLSSIPNQLDENEDDCFSNLGMLPELESIFNKTNVNNIEEKISFEDINFNHYDGTQQYHHGLF